MIFPICRNDFIIIIINYFAMTLFRVQITIDQEKVFKTIYVLNAFYMSFNKTRPQSWTWHFRQQYLQHQNMQSAFCFVLLKNKNFDACSLGFKLVYITFQWEHCFGCYMYKQEFDVRKIKSWVHWSTPQLSAKNRWEIM